MVALLACLGVHRGADDAVRAFAHGLQVLVDAVHLFSCVVCACVFWVGGGGWMGFGLIAETLCLLLYERITADRLINLCKLLIPTIIKQASKPTSTTQQHAP